MEGLWKKTNNGFSSNREFGFRKAKEISPFLCLVSILRNKFHDEKIEQNVSSRNHTTCTVIKECNRIFMQNIKKANSPSQLEALAMIHKYVVHHQLHQFY